MQLIVNQCKNVRNILLGGYTVCNYLTVIKNEGNFY